MFRPGIGSVKFTVIGGNNQIGYFDKLMITWVMSVKKTDLVKDLISGDPYYADEKRRLIYGDRLINEIRKWCYTITGMVTV